MPDAKISALTAITTLTPATDVLPVVDVTGTTKKITSNQILGAGGIATLASATITGDLTVDTSTLKVDSANNRVGVLTATPAATFSALIGSEFLHFGFGANNDNYYTVGSSGTHIWRNSGTEQMRLNSTGLGVGRSPSYRLQASSGTKTTTASLATVAGITTTDTDDFGIYFRLKTDATGTNRYAAITSFDNGSGNGARDLVLQDLGGNVGIGVTPSVWNSSAKAFEIGTAGNSVFSSAATFVEMTNNAYLDSASNWARTNTGNAAARFRTSGSGFLWAQAAAGANPISWTQAMTLDASGKLILGTTGAYNAARLTVQSAGGAGGISTAIQNDNDSYYAINFRNSSGVSCGSISCLTSSTAFNTSSDYRLKESVQPIIGALSRISALKPSIYKWKVDGSSGEGFLAHELAETVPLAVTGEKDAINEDGSIKPQQVDLSKIVPVLVAAIQELTARVQTLETR